MASEHEIISTPHMMLIDYIAYYYK